MLEIDYKPIDELFELKKIDFSVGYVSDDYNRLHELFDEQYNIEKYEFSFEYCCSELIKNIFDEYVTQSTIIITSRRDHPSVETCLQTYPCAEIIYLDDGDYVESDQTIEPRLRRPNVAKEFSLRKLSERLSRKDYSNILFLSYGSNVCDGEVRENRVFQHIFQVCEEYCENTIKVLDDCQGCMWIDRDYSLFDYVLWTAHATLYAFDVGIMMSKPGIKPLGIHNVGEEFLFDNYKRLLMNREFALSWNRCLTEATGVHLSNAPHLFNLKFTKDYPDSYFRDIQRDKPNISKITNINIEAQRYIRLRVEPFMNDKGKFTLLRALRFILDEKEFICD